MPSDDIAHKYAFVDGELRGVQLAPKSTDVYTLPERVTATSFEPSALEAAPHQSRAASVMRAVHELPELADV
jgi:hypothetical protein